MFNFGKMNLTTPFTDPCARAADIALDKMKTGSWNQADARDAKRHGSMGFNAGMAHVRAYAENDKYDEDL